MASATDASGSAAAARLSDKEGGPRYVCSVPHLVQAHPWAYDWNAAPRFDESRDSGLLQALRARLVAAP